MKKTIIFKILLTLFMCGAVFAAYQIGKTNAVSNSDIETLNRLEKFNRYNQFIAEQTKIFDKELGRKPGDKAIPNGFILQHNYNENSWRPAYYTIDGEIQSINSIMTNTDYGQMTAIIAAWKMKNFFENVGIDYDKTKDPVIHIIMESIISNSTSNVEVDDQTFLNLEESSDVTSDN
jgi:hypothetical protein